jgi:signal transduction histidine kinase
MPGGESIFLIAMLEDATESRRAAEKSRAAEKMEVIGRLAGGIAHDFNNLLTGILLYCDLLSAGIERGSRLLQHVEEIRLAGEQGAALTQQLLAIARKQAPQPRPILLNYVVSSTENLLRRLIGGQIDLVTVLAPNLRTVLADQAQLRQVLLNLVLNARDAMPHGGRITVSTQANDRLSGAQATVSLLVEDTGCGMDEGTLARLFEPFFTTKQPGHGTGLGLATVQRIVSEAGGTIEVKSEAGHGTRIEVLLPATEAVPAASVSAGCSRAAGETILLVDNHSERSQLHTARPAPCWVPCVAGFQWETGAESLEKQTILNALAQVNGDKMLAARLLGIGKTTFYRKLKEYAQA